MINSISIIHEGITYSESDLYELLFSHMELYGYKHIREANLIITSVSAPDADDINYIFTIYYNNGDIRKFIHISKNVIGDTSLDRIKRNSKLSSLLY